MADLKISQLTGATTPLAGTEVVPLVQSGTTKKVAVSNLTAGRDVEAATLTTTGKVRSGTSSDDGSISNTAVFVGGIHKTASGTAASAATGVVQDLVTLPAAGYATYIATTACQADDPSGYQGTHLIMTQGANARLVALAAAGSMSVSMSGLTLRASQSSGITLDIKWTVIRIA